MDALWLDLRVAARRLARNPGFTLVAVITLALGIGANSAIFSLINAVLLRPLPFRDQERLVSIYETRNGQGENGISAHELIAWQRARNVVQDAAMYRGADFTRTGRGDATGVHALRTTANLFEVFGIKPAIGRGFVAGEDSAGAPHVVVLSHAYWAKRFSNDSAIVGSSITLDNEPYRVVGVMSPSGEFDPDAWVTLDVPAEALTVGRHALSVVARLLPGVTAEQAQRELDAISVRLEHDLPQFNTGHRPRLVSVYEDVVGDSKRAVFVVLGAVGFVLLIACANVAHLLLARAAKRQREVAICAVVGASRPRLLGQLLSESILLSVVGGAVGLLLATWIVALVPKIHAVQIPRLAETRVDGITIAVTFGIALLTGIASGLVPAVRMSRVSLTELVSTGGGRSTAASRGFANILVVSEVALAFMLVAGAGLMIKSFARLLAVRPGFDPDHVLVVSTALTGPRYGQPAAQRDAFEDIGRRVASLPGVVSVGATTDVPIAMCCNGMPLEIENAPPPPPGESPSSVLHVVSGDYFGTLRIPVRAGRVFTPSDARVALPLIRWWDKAPLPVRFNEPQAAPVAVINETMARVYWPGVNAVGHRFKTIASPWISVIGVVGDVHHRGLGTVSPPEFYLAASQEPRGELSLLIRTAGTPLTLGSAVRGELRAFDRDLRVADPTTMSDVVKNSVGRPRFNALALGSFAAIAVLLALVGIYGVMSSAVAQRTREIGIRAALGANPRNVLRLVVGRATALTAVGLAIGAAGALAMGGVVKRLLFDITPSDPATYVTIALSLLGASLLASYLPARRALSVDPLTALRRE
ncbi:MAG TPA: ABC transporter permease [Gemmatimonadaceae bacterium]|nr:ABC transporter permease [Gemmatimonadaceae bacterium]